MKILIIEDEEALAKVLKEKLEKEGYEVEVVDNGGEAFAVAEKARPNIIILDLILPKKDGFEVLAELKSHVELKLIPVVVLSNLGEDEHIKRALSLGASDYFVKTQHPLLEIVEKVKTQLTKGGAAI